MSQQRAQEVEDYLIAYLPGIKKREWNQAPWDLIFEPQNQKIEYKYSGEKQIEHRALMSISSGVVPGRSNERRSPTTINSKSERFFFRASSRNRSIFSGSSHSKNLIRRSA